MFTHDPNGYVGYVLCRPEGGLNDLLSQTGRCFDYCLRHGRTLVVDSENIETFAEPFARYFEINHPRVRVIRDASGFIAEAQARGLGVFPPHARLVHGEECPAYDAVQRNYCLGGEPVTFDFGRIYEAPVLIHHQCGMAPQGAEFLRSLRLSAEICREVAGRWRALPKPYLGVHIRHTDIKGDIGPVLPLFERYRGPVFLATDSAAVQARIRILRPRGLFTTDIPDFGGNALHFERVTGAMKTRVNMTAVVDLVLLALAENVYAAPGRSGYSILAKALNRTQQTAVRWIEARHAGAGFVWALRLNLMRNKILRGWRHRPSGQLRAGGL
jgi:hypothetical protein